MSHNRETLATPTGDSTAAQKRTPFPKLQVFILLLIQFSEPVTAFVIYPFIMQLARDTNITRGDETKTAYFAGIIESVFFLAECLTVVYFGRASDRYGRRPVLLCGPLGLSVSMLGFGLSKSFWSLLVFRSMQGAFNGNIEGVSKSVMVEISDSTNIGKIYSLLPFMWTVGVAVGPFIGGTLANLGSRYQDTLGKINILKEFPYLTPCATAGALAFCTFLVGLLGLKETLPAAIARQKKSQPGTEAEPLLPDTSDSSQANLTVDEVPPLRDLFIRPVFIALLNHGFLCFCQMSFDVRTLIDRGYPRNDSRASPLQIGRIMSGVGLLNVFAQSLVTATAIDRFGPRTIFIATFCYLSSSFLAYPLLNFFVRRAGAVDSYAIIVMILQMVSNLSLILIPACTQMFMVDSALTQNSLGGVNALGQMVSSIFRSFAPSFAASLFSTSVSYNVLGGNLGFIVLGVISLSGVICALLLPPELPSRHS
ncbi:major facilitator superfamily multidrug-resistance, DHA1 sub-family [Mycena galopus ATCC 62051]|nr:major facilitator superfamily multidrug-resistance, DHA1 sub-family [Mycena galopus ATCC 62051]